MNLSIIIVILFRCFRVFMLLSARREFWKDFFNFLIKITYIL